MSHIDQEARELNIKIVYAGPALAGKRTNIHFAFAMANPEGKGKVVFNQEEDARSLSFHFLPRNLKEIHGHRVRLHLHTVPGAVFYNTSHERILTAVDGIIFVADSQEARKEANIEAMEVLVNNLKFHGLSLAQVPIVLQYNKRDFSADCMSLEEMDKDLRQGFWPRIEASAFKGVGVIPSLKALLPLIISP